MASFSLLALLLVSGACGKNKTEQFQAPLATGKLAGDYRAQATNPGGGGDYTAAVTIAPRGAYYALTWSMGKNRRFTGVGIEVPGLLATGWGNDGYHVFVYELVGKRLVGHWANAESGGKLGVEVLEGPTTLNGSYRIVDGREPTRGARYDGTVSIAPNGAVYRLKRTRSDGIDLEGVGIKKGNRLMVGAGPRGAAGVTVYTLRDRALSGQWAETSNNLLGTEYLTRL